MRRNLHTETQALLAGRPKDLSLREIAEDTGLNVNWLRKFLDNHIPDPGVNKVEALYDYLTAANPDEAA